MNRIEIKVTLPGKIVHVSDDRKTVTLECPSIDVQIVTNEARKVLTDGMSIMEAEVLIERICHHATTESLRSRIGMGCLTFIHRDEETAKY